MFPAVEVLKSKGVLKFQVRTRLLLSAPVNICVPSGFKYNAYGVLSPVACSFPVAVAVVRSNAVLNEYSTIASPLEPTIYILVPSELSCTASGAASSLLTYAEVLGPTKVSRSQGVPKVYSKSP